jgi:hypothetical protein
MSRTYLVQASPIDPATRRPKPVRLAGGGVRPYTHLNYEDWRAGVVALPLFSAAIGFGQTGWTGGTVPTTGALQFAPSSLAHYTDLAGAFWPDARVTVMVGDDEAKPPVFTLFLKAKVAKQEAGAGVVSLTVSDLSGDLDKPVITARFTGKGGIEGDTDVEGREKRRSYGRVFNVEGRILLAADNVYEFGDPTRQLRGFGAVRDGYNAIRDKGRAAPEDKVITVAWQGTPLDTLTALRAAVAPEGGAAVAPSIACAKWWTQPSGPLTADIRGEGGDDYAETAAGIAAALVSTGSELTVSNTAIAAAVRPGAAGLHIEDTSETYAGALDRLLLGVSLVWIVTPAGQVEIVPFGFERPPRSVWRSSKGVSAPHGYGATPARWGGARKATPLRSTSVVRHDVLRPVKSRRVGYQRNHRTQTEGEISVAVLGDPALYAGTDADPLAPTYVDWLKAVALYAPATDDATAWGDSAVETEIISPLAFRADALAEARRQLNILSGPFALDEHIVEGRLASLIGKTVALSGDRLGYEIAPTVFVIGVAEQANNTTALTVIKRL